MATENVDYEKQFEEDLERAQALSLESLALEQFRNQKRLQELNISPRDVTTKISKSTSVSRTSSMNESDCGPNRPERHQIKSRPRPGTVAGNQPNPMIAPPPTCQRRHSTTCTATDTATPDLISFTSPPMNDMVIEFCQQINNSPADQTRTTMSSSSMVSSSVHSVLRSNSMVQQYQMQQYRPQAPVNLLNTLFSSHSPQWQYGSAFGGGSLVPTDSRASPNMLQNIPAKSVNIAMPNPTRIGWNLSQTPPPGPAGFSSNVLATTPPVQQAPVLPPKNQQQTPPPLVIRSSKSTTKISQFARHKKSGSYNLIDLAPSGLEDRNSVRVSILEAFDPLLTCTDSGNSSGNWGSTSPDCTVDDMESVSGSVYDEYDPYDFIYSGSGNNSLADPMYAAVVKQENAPMSPPSTLSRRVQQSTMERRKSSKDSMIKKKMLLYDNITVMDQTNGSTDSDLMAFHHMVQNLRNQFRYDDPDTNMGLVVSPLMNHQYRDETSIKVCVFPQYENADFNKPVSFTCDVTSSVEHITLHVTCELEAPSTDQYTLKVWGYNEYLAPTTLLSDYEYVHNCIKLEEDVQLILIPDRLVDRSFARTAQDDKRDREIKQKDVVPNEPISPLSYDNLKILLETLENEVEKLEQAALQIEKNASPNYMPPLQPSGVIQSVKLVVKLLGTVETLDISDALDGLKESCQKFLPQGAQVVKIALVFERLKYN